MKRIFKNALQGLLLMSMLIAAGTARAADQVEAVLTQLGILNLLQDIPDVLGNSIEQKQKETGELTRERAAELKALYQKHYRAEDLLRDIAAQVKAQVKEGDIRQVVNLLASDQGRKLVALRKAATGEKAFEEIRALSGSHKDKPLSDERQQLLEALDSASADTEFFVATQALAIYGIMNGFHRLGLQGQDTGNTDAMLSMIYEQLLRPSHYTVFITQRYTFRDVSDQEIMDYIQIYRFGPMQNLLRATMEALSKVLLDRSDKVAGALAASSS